MDIRFDGKKVLITGAGKGIGRDTAKALARCGASVIALSRTQADLDSLQKEIPGVKTACVDVGNWDATRKAVSELGVVDFLVNNAAIAREFMITPFLEFTKQEIDEIFDVNIKAIFNITQVVTKAMVDSGKHGVIVNVSSILSERAVPGKAIYSATKAALDMLTKTLSVELGKHKIRIASVQPALTKTPGTTTLLETPGFADANLPKHTVGRFCETEDVVNAILFLLSNKASMVHGSNLYVDGGFMAW